MIYLSEIKPDKTFNIQNLGVSEILLERERERERERETQAYNTPLNSAHDHARNINNYFQKNKRGYLLEGVAFLRLLFLDQNQPSFSSPHNKQIREFLTKKLKEK